MAHTPGEWRLHENPDGLPFITDQKFRNIAFIRDMGDDTDGNAKLISEAPQLAAWKEEAMTLLTQWDDIGDMVGGAVGSSKVDNVRNELARLRDAKDKLAKALTLMIERGERCNWFTRDDMALIPELKAVLANVKDS